MPDAALFEALERNEFEVHYQPRVSLSTKRIVCVEALVRWAHPARGLVLPTSFMPDAERAGIRARIEDRVMEVALEQVEAWRTSHAGRSSLAVSVNLSAERFRHTELVDRLASSLDELHLDASAVQLELTHYEPLDPSQATTDTLLGLKALGVRLTVDNFGAGYSSLGSLHRVPADHLSIDKSFVGKLGVDEKGYNVVDTISSLAHALGLQVAGKGVENAGQARMLRKIGCEFGQGNYFSEPVPSHEMSELLR